MKARVRNLAAAKNVEAEVILRSFMFERLLERIADSEYRRNFVLKGGMLIAQMVGIDTRSTMDLDASLRGYALTESIVAELMDAVIRVPIDDGVSFALCGIEQIRESASYPGYRVSIEGTFDKTRQRLKVDLTAGDCVTPQEVEYDFRLMFEDRSIRIVAYNLETVLAEKYETIIVRGVANTRMRDFYDVYILTKTRPYGCKTFRVALLRTAETRRTVQQLTSAAGVIEVLATSTIMIDAWRRYQQRYAHAACVSWDEAINALRGLSRLL